MFSRNAVSRRARVARRAESLKRFSMAHLLSESLPLYIVNSYPKSGSSWLSQMLGSALDIPYRHRAPTIETSVLHTHYLHRGKMKNVVVVWRDGRDVMVSFYHHCVFPFPDRFRNAELVSMVRKDLHFSDYTNVIENLPTFIEYAFTRSCYPRFSWSDFVRQWYPPHKDVVHVRYEDLRQNTVGELQRIVRELADKELDPMRATEIAEEFSFVRQAGRRPGIEDKGSFMRKGTVGDWREHFSREAREVFDKYAGDELILLGYEPDRAWVDEAAA